MGSGSEGRGGAGARTPKSAATRERILDVACDLVVERGGADFPMGEVSGRCGMSKGSLYYYFADRDELVRAVLARAVDELVRAVGDAAASAPTAADAVGGMLRALAGAMGPGGALALAMSVGGADSLGPGGDEGSGARLSRVVDLLAGQLERARAEGLVREGVDCRLAAAAVAGAFLAFERMEPAGPAPSADDVVASVADLAFSGMGTAAGRALFSAGATGAPTGDGPARPRGDGPAPAPLAVSS